MRIPSGVTDQYIYFVAVDSVDFQTRETGLTTFTVYRSRDGAAAAAYTTPTINETSAANMPGVYELLLDEDMTIAAGNDSEAVCLHITHAGMAPVSLMFELYRRTVTAGNTYTVDATGGGLSTLTTSVNGYDGGFVWFDTAGVAGTTNYVHGIALNPNSSMANARTIANSLSIKGFRICNGSTVTLDQGYSGYTFFGYKWTLALASRLITNSYFQGAAVTGLSTGTGPRFENCSIGTSTIADASVFSNCGMNGTFTLQAAGQYVFQGCWSDTVAGVDWIIDFGALGATTVGLREYNGGVEVRNMAAGDVLSFTGSGRLTVAASCTAGSLFVSGSINLVNSGSGQTIADSSRYNEDQRMANVTLVDTVTTLTTLATDAIGANQMSAAAANKISDHTLRRTYANARASANGDTVNFRSALGAVGKLVNKWSISGSVLTIYQEDDTTSTAPGGTQDVGGSAGADPITSLDTV